MPNVKESKQDGKWILENFRIAWGVWKDKEFYVQIVTRSFFWRKYLAGPTVLRDTMTSYVNICKIKGNFALLYSWRSSSDSSL